ncbi:MAG: polyprenyl synthetase family protein [Rikenellaceae bacterium]|nr:polyprenyl synthetase family protein [Rikenellaceae bacterium]
MTRTEHLGQAIEQYIAQIDYPAEPSRLYDPIRYTMEQEGKRLRPMLVAMTHGLWHDDPTEALPAAAAVEMFHNFTLLHDDIMDNAPLRRGRPSVYNRWGSNVAILSGDELMIYSYRELCRVRAEVLPAVLGYFNEAGVRVCEGQQSDMDFEGREGVTLSEYIAMIELKTSALFVGAVSMGAVIAGASAADVERLRDFAREFGVAFQMQDDLLDAYGDARLGKSVGGDILEGKKTFLKLWALARATPEERVVLSTAHLDPDITPAGKIERVLAIYNRYGAREATEREITRRFEVAASSLNGLSAGSERVEEFKAFALSLLGRTK